MTTTVIRFENGAIFGKMTLLVFKTTPQTNNFLTFGCDQLVQKVKKATLRKKLKIANLPVTAFQKFTAVLILQF